MLLTVNVTGTEKFVPPTTVTKMEPWYVRGSKPVASAVIVTEAGVEIAGVVKTLLIFSHGGAVDDRTTLACVAPVLVIVTTCWARPPAAAESVTGFGETLTVCALSAAAAMRITNRKL